MRTSKRIAAVLLGVLAAVMLLPVPALAAAQPQQIQGTGTLRLNAPVPGLTLDIYRIGNVYEDGRCELVTELDDYKSLVAGKSWEEVASTLGPTIASIAAGTGWSPADSVVTAQTSGEVFAQTKELPSGLYLVTGRNVVESEGYTYEVTSSLISLPRSTADDMTKQGYTVAAGLKYSANPIVPTVNRRVV